MITYDIGKLGIGGGYVVVRRTKCITCIHIRGREHDEDIIFFYGRISQNVMDTVDTESY